VITPISLHSHAATGVTIGLRRSRRHEGTKNAKKTNLDFAPLRLRAFVLARSASRRHVTA
jgi:hypothetical protein